MKPLLAAFVAGGTIVAACGGGDRPGPVEPESLPAPALTRVEPDTLVAGGPAMTLVLSGEGLVTASVARWNGIGLTTRLTAPGRLETDVPSDRLAEGGLASVTVFNHGPGGGTSGSVPVTVRFPPPVLDSIAPRFIPLGSGPTEVVLYGSGFIGGPNGTRVFYGPGAAPPSWYQRAGGGTMRLYLPPDVLSAVYDVDITVENGEPGGGRSVSRTMSVHWGMPTIRGVDPASVAVGSEVELRVNVRYAAPTAVLRWNGRDLPTERFTISTDEFQLRATLTESDVSAPGIGSITAWNPPPGGGESPPMLIEIVGLSSSRR